MTVYELIQELIKYQPDAEVYFRADGWVSDYKGNQKEQNASADDDRFTVDGEVIGVKDWCNNPEIQCNILY